MSEIDVAGCEFYKEEVKVELLEGLAKYNTLPGGGWCTFNCNNIPNGISALFKMPICLKNPNCHYKQHKAKELEYKSLQGMYTAVYFMLDNALNQNKTMRKGLMDVISPLAYLKRTAEQKGKQLDGDMVCVFLKEPSLYQNIAKQTLEEVKSEK